MAVGEIVGALRALAEVSTRGSFREYEAGTITPWPWFAMELRGSPVLVCIDGPDVPVRVIAGVAATEPDAPDLLREVAAYANRYGHGGAYVYFGNGVWYVALRMAVHPQIVDEVHPTTISWFAQWAVCGLGEVASIFRADLQAAGIPLRLPDSADVWIASTAP